MYSSIIRAIEMNGFSIVIRRRGAQNGSQSFSINLARRAARNVVDAERCQRVAALGRQTAMPPLPRTTLIPHWITLIRSTHKV